MRFKNYRNSHTNEDKIYSRKNIADMSVREAFSRKDEIMAQHNSIGIPSEGELQSSPNAVWVEAYTRDDGTEVRGHWRSKPNSGGGVNNDMGLLTGDASEGIEEKEQKENSSDVRTESISNKQSNETIEQTEQTSGQEEKYKDKRLYPDEVAGVKRGEPKTFEQMMQQGVNPKYMSEEDEKGDYSSNCQSCTVAAELVMRGYDVEAGPYSTPEAKELGNNGKTAYIDPETGKECVADIIYTNEIDCYNYLEQNVKQGERYELTYNTPTESGNNEYDIEHEYDGHVVLITRNEKGEILYYDPQRYERFEGKEVRDFISTWFQYEHVISAPPRILRIDNKALNPKYVNAVVRKRSN